MHKSILVEPKGYQPARKKTISLFLSISLAITSAISIAPQANSQVPIGLGISLGSMLLSGVASAHGGRENRRINTKNKAIDANNDGIKYLDHKQYDQAVNSFMEALRIDSSLIDAHWNLAITYKKMDDYQNCLAQTELVLQKRQSDTDVLFMAALACQHLHKYSAADQYYQRYLTRQKSGENADYADRATQVLEHVFLSAPDGDYVADATKEGMARWADEKMPLKVFIKEDSSLSGYMPEFSSTLKEAFRDWSDISEGRISFAFTENQSDAQIICAWTDDKMTLGGTKELGLTHTERENDKIIAARIDLYTLVDRPGSKKEELIATAKSVDLHEIGHALGLEHSQAPYDVMYFETAPDGLEFPLTPRDKNTILSIYSQSSTHVAQLPPSRHYASSSAPSPSSVDDTGISLQGESPTLK